MLLSPEQEGIIVVQLRPNCGELNIVKPKHQDRNSPTIILLQSICLNWFSWMQIVVIWFQFHWRVFLMVLLTASHHCFRKWLVGHQMVVKRLCLYSFLNVFWFIHPLYLEIQSQLFYVFLKYIFLVRFYWKINLSFDINIVIFIDFPIMEPRNLS